MNPKEEGASKLAILKSQGGGYMVMRMSPRILGNVDAAFFTDWAMLYGNA